MSELEQKALDAKAAYAAYVDALAADAYAAWVAYRDADNKGALAADAYVDATATYVDTGAAYIKARDELEEYKEQDNE